MQNNTDFFKNNSTYILFREISYVQNKNVKFKKF